MFKSAYDHNTKEYITEAGSELQNEYGYEVNKKGQKILIKTGETNLYKQIQEELESTKIENILAEAAVGDMSHFRPDGIYADISEAPSNLVEAQQQIQKMENLWNELPIETKEHYNHDIGEFIAESGKDHWLKDVGILAELPEIDEPKEAPEIQPLGQINSHEEAKKGEEA